MVNVESYGIDGIFTSFGVYPIDVIFKADIRLFMHILNEPSFVAINPSFVPTTYIAAYGTPSPEIESTTIPFSVRV